MILYADLYRTIDNFLTNLPGIIIFFGSILAALGYKDIRNKVGGVQNTVDINGNKLDEGVKQVQVGNDKTDELRETLEGKLAIKELKIRDLLTENAVLISKNAGLEKEKADLKAEQALRDKIHLEAADLLAKCQESKK